MITQGAALVVFDETNEIDRHSSYLGKLDPRSMVKQHAS